MSDVQVASSMTSTLLADPSKLHAWPCSAASYSVLRPLGQGAFSRVFLARRTSAFEASQLVALKVTPRYADPIKTPSRELEVMLLLRDSPHVCHLLEYFFLVGEKASHSVLVLEAFTCNLRSIVMEPPVLVSRLRQARAVGQQLSRALSHMHGLGVIHRDIKTDNVLIQSDEDAAGPAVTERPQCVLADFGAAKLLKPGEHSSPFAFARHYRAPELCLGSPTYTTAPDVWALGCILGEVLLGGVSLLAPPSEQSEQASPVAAPPLRDVEVRDIELGMNDSERQLLTLFDHLGTPSWSELVSMNPTNLSDDTQRCAQWMSIPPREPSLSWREHLVSSLRSDVPKGRAAIEGAEAESLTFYATALLAAIFTWDPEARPSAQALGEFAFLKEH